MDDNERETVAKAMERLRSSKAGRDAQRRKEGEEEATGAARERRALGLWAGTVAAMFVEVHRSVADEIESDVVLFEFEPDTEIYADVPLPRSVIYEFASPEHGTRASVTRYFHLREGGIVRTATSHRGKNGKLIRSPPETTVGPVDAIQASDIKRRVLESLVSFTSIETG